MSNRSRGRNRPVAGLPPDDGLTPAERLEQEAHMETVADAFDTLEVDKKRGLDKLVGLIMRDREKALAKPELKIAPQPKMAGEPLTHDKMPPPYREPLRQPTAYESAILFAMGNRTAIVGTGGARPPIEMPLTIVSGGIYTGSVEPARVAHNRRRNKAARAARSGKRRRTYGRVYQSPFGYRIHVPGISVDTIVDAEVIEDDASAWVNVGADA